MTDEAFKRLLRRRIEDALRKTCSLATMIKIAVMLGVRTD